MSNILLDAAIEYRKLKDVRYKIVLGRKGKTYHIMLHFSAESFYHLAGLQHLKDITFPSKNKERIYKEIIKEKITEETICKSVFYEKCFIEERLKEILLLKEMIESNSIYYLINANRYRGYTDIRADYLCQYEKVGMIYYLFLIIEKRNPLFLNECKCCSLFMKHDTDYTYGAAKTTVLLIEKIDNGNKEVIYRNPTYDENK